MVARKEAMYTLLDALTDEECVKILWFVRQKESNTAPGNAYGNVRAILPGHLGSLRFFGFVHWILYGSYSDGGQLYYELLNKTEKLKEKLAEITLPELSVGVVGTYDIDLTTPCPPPVSELSNPSVGKVKVTEHAWLRFRLRLPKSCLGIYNSSQEVEAIVAKLFVRIFARAKPRPIGKRYQLGRILRNGNVLVHYLYDRESNLRFVVSKDTATLLTVEQSTA